MRNIYWSIQSSGLYSTDPKARLIIDEYHKKDRVHSNPTNNSLQRLIRLSEYFGVEIADGQITVYGSLKPRGDKTAVCGGAGRKLGKGEK